MKKIRLHSHTGPLLSANANNTTNAGSRYANTNNRVSNANANRGFRQYRKKDNKRLCDPASWQKKPILGSGERSPLPNGTFKKFTSYYNLVEAALMAQKNKRKSIQIESFNQHFGDNIQQLRDILLSEKPVQCHYRKMIIREPKERKILIAPFYPHRIIHQAIVLVMKETWINNFIDNTFACLKGRGIHPCMFAVRDTLRNDVAGTKFCLKLDVNKYFDNINHKILKCLIAQELNDEKMFKIICDQIDTVPQNVGIPIGNLTSQYFANIYLTPLDHFCKEILNLKYYFRYMDDVVIFDENKKYLHHCRIEIEKFLNEYLSLQLKENWQVFPVDCRQVDFVGYRINHLGVMLRKSILLKFYSGIEELSKIHKEITLKHQLSSHHGWLKYIDENHKQNILKNAEIKHKVILN
jgi:RNA-directed DNA polymerase